MADVEAADTPAEYTDQLMGMAPWELFGNLHMTLLRDTGVTVTDIPEDALLLHPIVELVSADVWGDNYKVTAKINKAGFSLGEWGPKLNGQYSKAFGPHAGGKGIVIELPRRSTVSVSRKAGGVTSARHSGRTAEKVDTVKIGACYEYDAHAAMQDGTVKKIRAVGWMREAFLVITWTNEPHTGTNTNAGEILLIGGLVSESQVTYKVRYRLCCSPSPQRSYSHTRTHALSPGAPLPRVRALRPPLPRFLQRAYVRADTHLQRQGDRMGGH
jgi:hypothetical protein